MVQDITGITSKDNPENDPRDVRYTVGGYASCDDVHPHNDVYHPGGHYKRDVETASDPVDHPKHYTSHPSGVECIQITEWMNFNLGNALKYIWRADLKSDNPIEDLEKSIWYIQREINRLESNGLTEKSN